MCSSSLFAKLEVSEKQKRNYHDRISKMTLMKKKGKEKIQIAFFTMSEYDEICIINLKKS